MLASQFHAEFKSRPNRPHPLFLGFINAAKETLVDGSPGHYAVYERYYRLRKGLIHLGE